MQHYSLPLPLTTEGFSMWGTFWWSLNTSPPQITSRKRSGDSFSLLRRLFAFSPRPRCIVNAIFRALFTRQTGPCCLVPPPPSPPPPLTPLPPSKRTSLHSDRGPVCFAETLKNTNQPGLLRMQTHFSQGCLENNRDRIAIAYYGARARLRRSVEMSRVLRLLVSRFFPRTFHWTQLNFQECRNDAYPGGFGPQQED